MAARLRGDVERLAAPAETSRREEIMNPAGAESGVIVQEITIDAPAARVFAAFTNPSERVLWWNADDGRFRTTHMESDLRPGGRWEMRGTRGDGSPFTVKGEYRAVEPPHMLEFTWL